MDHTELIKALRSDAAGQYTRDAAAAIEELQAEVNKKRTADCWGCKCEKVEPKRGQVCLVYDEDGYMSVATYTGDKYFPTAYGFHVNGEEVTDITHWMPIEPPKEGE